MVYNCQGSEILNIITGRALHRRALPVSRIVVSCNQDRNSGQKVKNLYAVTIRIVQMPLAKAFVILTYSHHGWYSYRDMEIPHIVPSFFAYAQAKK